MECIWGGIFTFIARTIMKMNACEVTVSEIWMYMGAGIVEINVLLHLPLLEFTMNR
ncbi:hypothetical protein WMZ97_15815 [Lentibacillus sp. N15]|uniref:hypothetical protein n=1 Tax=Lentibacillus songyuanensis TaxID=3136161 RepID=UPI0031BAC511